MSKGGKNKTIQENSTIQEYADGRNYDATAVRNIAQEWVDKHMKNREQEFTKGAECSLFCGTWNVNAKKQEGGLQDWLLPPNSQQSNFDIYAIGFQEIVDLNAVNVALNSNNTQQRAQFWEDKITECLDSTGIKYRLIGEKYLVGLLLCIYVKESFYPLIRDIRVTSLGVGIMGMMGNKGGVSIRFSIYDSTICFICAHLAAHRENVVGRNNDYKNIYEKSLFTVTERGDEGGAGGVGGGNNNISSSSASSVSSSSNTAIFSPAAIIDSIIMPRQGAARYFDSNLTIPEHDIIFWMGDLNYRIDDSIVIEDIFRAIEKNDFELLRIKDQLNIERMKNRAFQGFHEGILNFAPTYKYQPGTDVYETRAEKKLRAPAWCDRILWKITNKDLIIKQNDYRRSNLLPSDHKPVSGNFNISLKEVVENKERIIFNELMSFLKKYPSKDLPILEMKGLKINFEKVLFEVKKESTIELSNVGESIAFWHFVPKLEESSVCKKWISLDKVSGLLLPGESVSVTVSIFVDNKTAHVLNAGKDLLQDVLILRIENSNDYYVDIKADYERSCFGMSLEDLIQFIQPISDLPLPAANPEFFYNLQLKQQQQQQQLLQMNQSNQGAFSENMTSSAAAASSATTKLSIPKELWRMIDALWAGNAIREKDLFNSPGDYNEIGQIRYAIDHGLEFNFQMSPHSLADCLIHFLNSLPKPLLPMELYPTAEIDPMNMRSFCRKFLEDLPTINYNVFVYLISFFREVLAEASYNRCTAEQLSSVCVQCMTSANGTTPSSNDDYFIDFSDNLSKEEKEKRLFRQSYVQQIIFHLLTTNSI